MLKQHLLTGCACLGALSTVWVAGCAGPMERSSEEALRESMISAHRAHLASMSDAKVIELSREPSDVESELSDERREELDKMSGLKAYQGIKIEPGIDLLGHHDAQVLRLSLQEAVAMTVKNNLDIQVARMTPAISETRIVQAQAVFDATFFTDVNYSRLDTPQPSGTVSSVTGNSQREDVELSTTRAPTPTSHTSSHSV